MATKRRRTKSNNELEQLKIQFRLMYGVGDQNLVDPENFAASAVCLSRVIPIIRDVYGLNDEEEGNHRSFTLKPHCLDMWEHPDRAAEWLYGLGVRPIKSLREME